MTETMKIVLVSQSYYPRPGGVTEHVHHSARELERLGHHVTIVTSNCANGVPRDPRVVRIGRNVLFPINGAWVNMTVGANLKRNLRRVFETIEPDVIHTHCPLAPTLPLLALQTAPKRCRVVGTFHAAADRSIGYSVFQAVLRRMARRLDARIAVSRAAMELAQRYIPGDYVVIPNGVDSTRFSPRHEPLDHLSDDAFNVLYVGRLDRRKGLKYLFEAVSIVASRVRRRIRLVVVGDESPRRFLLPRLPREVDLRFVGVVSKEMLPRYYRSGHVFCSPATDRESFGIVLLEAMASGIPVIGTSIPGYLTILKNRSNSLVVPPKDPRSLAKAIIELMRDGHLRARLRENGLRFARGYRWDAIAERLEQVYEDGRTTEPTAESACEEVRRGPVQVQKA